MVNLGSDVPLALSKPSGGATGSLRRAQVRSGQVYYSAEV
jgi:hypothetical protein